MKRQIWGLFGLDQSKLPGLFSKMYVFYPRIRAHLCNVDLRIKINLQAKRTFANSLAYFSHDNFQAYGNFQTKDFNENFHSKVELKISVMNFGGYYT